MNGTGATDCVTGISDPLLYPLSYRLLKVCFIRRYIDFSSARHWRSYTVEMSCAVRKDRRVDPFKAMVNPDRQFLPQSFFYGCSRDDADS